MLVFSNTEVLEWQNQFHVLLVTCRHMNTHMKIHPKEKVPKKEKNRFSSFPVAREFRSDNISFNLNSDIWKLSRTALDSLFLRKALKT